MQPIQFRGKRNRAGASPYVIWAMGLLGLSADVVTSFPEYAVGWAILWGGLGFWKAYAALLEWQGSHTEAQVQRDRIASLAAGVIS